MAEQPNLPDDFAHAAAKLELGAVLDIVARSALSDRAKERIRSSGPAGSPAEAVRLQEEAMELIRLAETGESLPLAGWRDTRDLAAAARAEGHAYGGEELAAIALSETKASEVHRFLGKHADRLPLVAERGRRLAAHGDLVALISRTIGPDFEVVDRASDTLARLRRDLNGLRSRLRRSISDFTGRIAGGKGYEFVTIRGERYVVSLPRGEAGRVRGIVHQASASGASLFVEPLEFVDENNRLEALLQDEREEVTRILRELSGEVFRRRDTLLGNQEVLLELDLASARAEFGRRFRCVLPEHGEDGRLALRAARHPLLEQRLQGAGALAQVKPLDLSCPADLKALVISGPNAGGKTVALKTIGLMVLMDRWGLLVPCAHGSRLPRYDTVQVDIGDDQSIERSLSTFSSRVLQLKTILARAGERSLVLIDEIGDGTDPEEGAAIAAAVLERLMRTAGRVIVTTHLTALKGWAHGTPGALNATLEFDPERLEPLFVLRMGVPGRSWGIEMAGRLGLPPEIVERANAGLPRDALHLEELLAHLEKTERLVSEERAALEKKESQLSGLIEGYRDRLDRLNEDRDGLLARARAEALDIVTSARRDMERLIREIRTTEAERSVVKAAHAAVDEKRARLAPKAPAKKAPGRKRPEGLAAGMWVEIGSLAKEGRIVALDGARAFVELDGGLRVETGIGDLFAPKDGGRPRGRRKTSWTMETHEAVSSEISVRGLEKAEALERVDLFLDRAVLQGLRTVTVIHGIGKGILKRALYDMLRKDPRVAGVRPGDPARGGDGLVIVDLK